MTEWETVGPGKGVTRDRYGRPMIRPPQPLNAAPTPYTRATTVAKTLEDQSALMAWKQRMTMLGLVARKDLLTAAAAATPSDRQELNRLAEAAADAGGATAAATTGTALHAFLERLDTGADLGHVPEEHHADVDAYAALAERVGWTVHGVEEFLVCDAYRIAGTVDRILDLNGRRYIMDLKTGSNVRYHHAWAAQLAIYARSVRYDPETEERLPWPVTPDGRVLSPDTDRALIVHVPAAQGRADAYWLDIAAGWRAVQLSMAARDWRRTRDLLTPYDDGTDPIASAIERATTVDALVALWQARAGDGWTEEHTAAAAARKASLTPGQG